MSKLMDEAVAAFKMKWCWGPQPDGVDREAMFDTDLTALLAQRELDGTREQIGLCHGTQDFRA